MDESQARPRPLCKMAKAGMKLFFDRVKVFEHVNGVYEMYVEYCFFSFSLPLSPEGSLACEEWLEGPCSLNATY